MGGVVVFAVDAFLLLTMGAAVIAAPITVPLMFLAARRHPTTAFRVAAIVLAALTAAQVVWALTYVQMGETKPWIWVLPVAAGALTAGCFAAGLASMTPWRDGVAGRRSPGTFARP